MKLNKKYCALIDSDNGYDNQLLADCCEKLADEHAIAFTDWCEDYYYPSSTKGIWFDSPDFDNAKQFLTKELLQIYKEKKGL